MKTQPVFGRIDSTTDAAELHNPIQKQLWALPADIKARLAAAYDDKFTFLFTQLHVNGTKAAVKEFVKAPRLHKVFGAPGVVAAPDDADLSD